MPSRCARLIGNSGDMPETSCQAPAMIGNIAAKLARREGRQDAARNLEILQWCEESAARFVDAPVQTYVPLLIERIVRDRMRKEHPEAERCNGDSGEVMQHGLVL